MPRAESRSDMSQAAQQDIMRDGMHAGPCLAEAKDHRIIECEACGFKHALPLPVPAALEQAYRENYYAEEKPNFLAHAGEDQAWFELSQTDRLEIFARLLAPERRRL